PLTSCRVAAITASVPGSRLATLRTRGPTASPGTVAAMAVSAVQHSGTRRARWTEPARWAYSQTPSKPAAAAASAPSRTSAQRAPNGSSSTSTRIAWTLSIALGPDGEERVTGPVRGRAALGDRRAPAAGAPEVLGDDGAPLLVGGGQPPAD